MRDEGWETGWKRQTGDCGMMHYFMYVVPGVCCAWFELIIMAYRDREG